MKKNDELVQVGHTTDGPVPEKDDYFGVAAHSFTEYLKSIEHQGRTDTPEWHMANGLLRLAQGLRQESRVLEERLNAIAALLRPRQ